MPYRRTFQDYNHSVPYLTLYVLTMHSLQTHWETDHLTIHRDQCRSRGIAADKLFEETHTAGAMGRGKGTRST
eukprot:COSAG02_NODE_52588_length_307_cov_0.485577_1_plen_72_part_01